MNRKITPCSHIGIWSHFMNKGVTCTICNVLYGWSRGQKNKQQDNAPNPKKQCSCRLSGSSENRAFEGWLGLLRLKETGYFMFQTQNYDMAACSSQRYIVPPTTLTESKQVNEFPLCFARLPHCVLISPNHYMELKFRTGCAIVGIFDVRMWLILLFQAHIHRFYARKNIKCTEDSWS